MINQRYAETNKNYQIELKVSYITVLKLERNYLIQVNLEIDRCSSSEINETVLVPGKLNKLSCSLMSMSMLVTVLEVQLTSKAFCYKNEYIISMHETSKACETNTWVSNLIIRISE